MDRCLLRVRVHDGCHTMSNGPFVTITVRQYNAMQDVIALARVIADAIEDEEPHGDAACLVKDLKSAIQRIDKFNAVA